MTANKKKWIVITSGDRSLDEVSSDLSKEGFTIENKMEAIGQITAESGEDVNAEQLSIEGVTAIVPMGDDIHIGDPDSELTW